MFKLSNLPKTTKRGKKRLGQGHGSGKGKTGGRGTKGQGARETISNRFSRGELAIFKRLPLYRGKYRNKPVAKKPVIVNIKYLNILKPNSVVDEEVLVKNHIITKPETLKYGIKILGDGEIKIPVILRLPCSKGALRKIEKAGGKVEEVKTSKANG